MNSQLPLIILVAGLISGAANTESLEAQNQPPPIVLEELCAHLLAERKDFEATMPIVVHEETRPIFNTFALRVLRNKGPLTPAEADSDHRHDTRLKSTFQPTPVTIPPPPRRCTWALPADPVTQYVGADEIVLELSNIVEDPIVQEECHGRGVFARISLGERQGASWFWISLKGEPGSWTEATVHLLPFFDG